MLIDDYIFNDILDRTMARWLSHENRGSLGPSLTVELLTRFITSAEFEYDLELTDLEKDDPGCGAYVRQYMRLKKGEKKDTAGRGMTFERMRECIGRAADAGWLGPMTNTIDVDASPYWRTVAEMMIEVDNDEIAFLVVQQWKGRKIARLESLSVPEVICDIHVAYLKFERDFVTREIESAKKWASQKYQAIKKIEFFGRLFVEDVLDEVRDEIRADARASRQRKRQQSL